MRMFLDRQRARPLVLDRVAQTMQRADARIAAPREDQLRHAARANHLVVDDVRRQAHHGQVAAPLTDDLVPRGERDEMREPLEGKTVAVAHKLLDGFPE